MDREVTKQVGGERARTLSGEMTSTSDPDGPDDGVKAQSLLNHPLLNDVILNNLFQYCTPAQINTCRLVCRTWRDVSLAGWRSSSTPKFCSWRDLPEHDPFFPIHRFIKYVKDSDNKYGTMPFRNFRLVGWEFHVGDDLKYDMEWMEEFLQLVGGHIKSLELDCCTFGGIREFRRVICGGCPNLENLVLNDIRVQNHLLEDNDDSMEVNPVIPEYEAHINLKSASILLLGTFTSGTFPMPWLNFFSTFPNMDSFSLEASTCDCCCANADPRTMELFEAINTIRLEDPQKLPIQNFYIRPFVKISKCLETQMTLNLIGELRIPLQSLSIILEPELDNEIVKDVLQVHGSTLAKIIVTGTYCPSPPFPFGVQLDNLQELEIMPGLCGNLEFFKFTPLLRRICNISL